jgi:hypothetical protein
MDEKFYDSCMSEFKNMDPALMEQMGLLLQTQLNGIQHEVTAEQLDESYASSGLSNTGYNAPYSNGSMPSYAELEAQFPFMALNLMRTAGPQLFTHKLCITQAIDRPDGSAYVMKFKYVDRTRPASEWREANHLQVPEHAGSTGQQNASGAMNYMVTGNVSPDPSKPIEGTWYDLTGIHRNNPNEALGGLGAHRTAAEKWGFDEGGGDFTFPELSISVARQNISVISRKCGATFTTEFLEDSNANNVNMIPLMMRALKKNLILTTERETIARVRSLCFRKGSPTALEAPHLVAEYGCSDFFTYYYDCAKAGGLWQQQKFGAISNVIVAAANDLLVRNNTGAGNICVVSPMIASILQCSGGQFRGIDTNIAMSATGIPEIGTINGGTIKVYVDSQARDNVCIVAFKGTDLAEAGLIYCPYKINLEYEAVESSSFGKRIGVANRYGWCVNRLGADLFYSSIYFDNVKELLRGADAPISIIQKA